MLIFLNNGRGLFPHWALRDDILLNFLLTFGISVHSRPYFYLFFCCSNAHIYYLYLDCLSERKMAVYS